ncbi:hypothetical protein MKW92_031966 [Papaver armeniacum]|nr:hypothetical protein MKW92_031966 [Papaver armeniacum]
MNRYVRIRKNPRYSVVGMMLELVIFFHVMEMMLESPPLVPISVPRRRHQEIPPFFNLEEPGVSTATYNIDGEFEAAVLGGLTMSKQAVVANTFMIEAGIPEMRLIKLYLSRYPNDIY